MQMIEKVSQSSMKPFIQPLCNEPIYSQMKPAAQLAVHQTVQPAFLK